jgi:hypothetical protein
MVEAAGVEPASYAASIRYYYYKNDNDKKLTKYDHRYYPFFSSRNDKIT